MSFSPHIAYRAAGPNFAEFQMWNGLLYTELRSVLQNSHKNPLKCKSTTQFRLVPIDTQIWASADKKPQYLRLDHLTPWLESKKESL